MKLLQQKKAGIDMIVANARNIIEVRKGSNKLFLTASLFWEEFVTKEEILKGKSIENGADAFLLQEILKLRNVI